MNFLDRNKEIKQNLNPIQSELEKKYQTSRLLYHGTTRSNANWMLNEPNNRISNWNLANQLCLEFGIPLAQVISDPETHEFFKSFVFSDQSGMSREREIYTATRLSLAGQYALRGPEWKYHLLIYFACKDLGLKFNVTNHIDEVENWILKFREQPAIVVIDASKYDKYPEEDEFMKNHSEGSTCILTYPLPDSVSVLEYFEWNFKFGDLS